MVVVTKKRPELLVQKLSLGLCMYKIKLQWAELTACKVTMAVSKEAQSPRTFRLNTINKLYCKKKGFHALL